MNEEPQPFDDNEFEINPGDDFDLSTAPPTRLSSRESLELPPVDRPRRRRPRRLFTRPDSDQRAALLEGMALRTAPNFDFFLFAMISGAFLGAGYILDSNALLLMGILVAPLLRPWLGMILSIATGEIRFFGQTLGGLFTGFAMVFVTGFLAGLASRIFLPRTFNEAFVHSRLWWPDLFLLAIGAILLAVSFIRSEEKPILPGLMLAYELFLPISAAGFGLGNGVTGLWPNALLIFLVHLALAIVLGMIVYYFLGFRPVERKGYLLGGIMLTLALTAAISLSGVWNFIGAQMIKPTPTADASLATQSALPTLAPTFTATATRRPATNTPAPTETPTLQPTPVYARIRAVGGGGIIRKSPGGDAITSVQNDYLVELLPDEVIVKDGTAWVHVLVRTNSGVIDGWVLQSLLVTATPAPTATNTPTITATATP
jgi:uncharacterized membrane protein